MRNIIPNQEKVSALRASKDVKAFVLFHALTDVAIEFQPFGPNPIKTLLWVDKLGLIQTFTEITQLHRNTYESSWN